MQRLRKEPKFLDDSEWEKLKAVVDDVYKDFTVRLHERFPQLSEVYIRYSNKSRALRNGYFRPKALCSAKARRWMSG